MNAWRWIFVIVMLFAWGVVAAQNTPEAAYAEALRRIESARESGATELDFTWLGLTTLPPEIGQLGNLQVLEVQGNALTALPPEIGQLGNLQWLYVADNQLTALPPEIGQLGNLQRLEVGINQLTVLPPEIGQLGNLQQLNISGNPLTALPPEIGQLGNLQVLHVYGNQLTVLPPEIGQLGNLQYLNARGNPLPYPPELLNAPDDGAALIAWLRTPTPIPPYRVGGAAPLVGLLTVLLWILCLRAGVRRIRRHGEQESA